MRRLSRDSSGSVAVLMAVGLLAMGTATAVGVDYARGLNFKSALQGAVDSAAIAGATAYVNAGASGTATSTANSYMTTAINSLPTNNGVTSSASTSSNSTGYSVTVTASATITASFTGLFINAIPVSVKAKAINPIVTVNFNLGNFSSSAWDANTVYYYLLKNDGSLPTGSELVKVYTNTSTINPNPAAVSVSSTQKIGFALKNVTGGNNGYGRNGYGGAQGSTHWFYSHISPISHNAYSSVNKNCSLQVYTVPSSGVWPATVAGCTTSNPSLATVSCATAKSQILLFAWNDMGGGSDDLDYDDAKYTFACSGSGGSSTEVYLAL